MLGNNKNQNFVSFVVFGKYDFKAEECDEITFKRGDPILVLEKDDEHKDGWWKGKTADKLVGLFPVEFTTFINIKHNVDGLFDELDNLNNSSGRESFTTNSSVGTGSNSHPFQSNSPQLSSSEMNTPKMKYADQSSIQSSPGYYNHRMSISSTSGVGSSNGSPQIIQQHPQIKPPHLSLNNPNNNLKEYHSIPPTSWTIDHVLTWLEDVGFSACKQIFIDNNIDGMKLLGQSLASLRSIGINQLKDRLKLYNSIVSLKEQYNHANSNNEENNIDNSIMMDQNQWHQHNRLYNNQYTIEEERDESVISESPSTSVMSPKERRSSEFINTSIVDNRNNTRQINGPAGMRPRLNNIVSRESLQLTSTNFSYYRSSQRVNRTPSQSSKSSISSISSFFRRLSFSKPDKKNDNVFEPMFQHADYQGWLWTRFNKNTKWKKRWIILSREKIYFLKEPKHPVNIKHTIKLNITFSIQPDIHKGKTKYTFNLIDSANQQVVYFSADNHLVMMTWINVLVRATTSASSRLQPLPEGKSPIIGSPNLIPQSPITGCLQPIYNVNHQIVQSPNPNSYHHYQNQIPLQGQNQVIRNQNMSQNSYINPSRNSIAKALSPRVQQSVTSPQVQVRNSNIVSPQLQSHHLAQPSRRSSMQVPITTNTPNAVDSSASLTKVTEINED
jgi:hypothetical protein